MKILTNEAEVQKWMERNRILVDDNNEVHVCKKCFNLLSFEWMSNTDYSNVNIECAGCCVKLTNENARALQE